MHSPEQIQQLTIDYCGSLGTPEEFLDDSDTSEHKDFYINMLIDILKDLAIRENISIATATPAQQAGLIAQFTQLIREPIRGAIITVEEQDMFDRVANLRQRLDNDPNADLGPDDTRLLNDPLFRTHTIRSNADDQHPMLIAKCLEVAGKHFNSVRSQPSGPPKMRG